VVPIIGQPPIAAAGSAAVSTAAAVAALLPLLPSSALPFPYHLTTTQHNAASSFSPCSLFLCTCLPHLRCPADNLYLDMNGIIHNCTHANNSEIKETEEQMIVKIFTYLDKLFHIVKPQARRAGRLCWVGLARRLPASAPPQSIRSSSGVGHQARVVAGIFTPLPCLPAPSHRAEAAVYGH
jgi:hypothetical protein